MSSFETAARVVPGSSGEGHAAATRQAWQERLRKGIGAGFAVFVALVMLATGLIALHEGTTRYLLPFTADDPAAVARDAVQAIRANPAPDTIGAYSPEMKALSAMVSEQHFAESRLFDQGVYYATMPTLNQVVLLGHILLGVFCLVVGGFQFWPGFRRRYMRLHRLAGMGYVATAPLSVIASLVYLALTPPHHIYNHLVAWLALWIFGALALVSIAMAVRAIRARRIHEHQAWMALSFGCLIVAPMLRWNWVLLAHVLPGVDQETINLVTMGVMLPEVLLIAYGLMLVNRQYDRANTRRETAWLAVQGTRVFLAALPLWYALALAVAANNVWLYLAGSGISSLPGIGVLVPAALLSAETQALADAGWIGAVLVYAGGVGVFLGVHLLARLLRAGDAPHAVSWRGEAALVAVLAMLTGAAATTLGVRIGVPSGNLYFAGGTLYTVPGVLLTVFGALLARSASMAHVALAKERLVFVLACLPFMALFSLAAALVNAVTLPADYIAAGQGYAVPVGFSLGLFFLALLHAVHGQATRQHG